MGVVYLQVSDSANRDQNLYHQSIGMAMRMRYFVCSWNRLQLQTLARSAAELSGGPSRMETIEASSS
jgi:hypothetical protein